MKQGPDLTELLRSFTPEQRKIFDAMFPPETKPECTCGWGSVRSYLSGCDPNCPVHGTGERQK